MALETEPSMERCHIYQTPPKVKNCPLYCNFHQSQSFDVQISYLKDERQAG